MEESSVVLLDFRALLEAAPDGIAVVDERGRILVANEELSRLFGYAPNALIGKRVEALVPERLRPGHEAHRRSYTTNPTTRPMGMGLELLGLRQDGSEFPLEISLSPVRSGAQTFTIAIVRDSTERRHLQSEEQALRTFLDTEQERHRIGMDLHDGIMQDIYAVTLGLELAHEDIDADPAQAKQAVGRSIDQLHDVIRDIRSYIFDLRPRQFTGDLRQALLDLGREFQENSSIPTNVFVPTELPPLEYSIGVAFYIITHEALSNTRKYAQATSVSIALRVVEGRLDLEIRDDGKGFDTSIELPEGHRGLRNMASRAGVIGADFEVESATGKGTRQDWRWALGVNLWGVIYGVHTFVPVMIEQDEEAHVVNTASMAGLAQGNRVYSVTKHAVVALSEALHDGLRMQETKVHASVLCPGLTNTQLMFGARNRPEDLRNYPDEKPSQAQLERSSNSKRLAEEAGLDPAQTAEMVLQAIKDQQFYILTHTEYDDVIRERMENILQRRNPVPKGPGLTDIRRGQR